MMKRFSRKRRAGKDAAKRTINASDWLPRILEAGVLDAAKLEPAEIPHLPESVAAIGRGERADGSPILVSFSPRSATEALLGGLAAANHLAAESQFAGTLFVVAPQWPSGARRVLGLLGRSAFDVEAVAAAGLSDARVIVEAAPVLPILATSHAQVAARLTSADSRAAFTRAAAALEGLAAKHGGAVRAGADRLELVVMARRVAELRADGESPVLEVQLGGRKTTPLSGSDLAGAMDGLEGQIRKRLNDRKVRDGEEGLRGRVVAQLASGDELRGLKPWPQPGVDLGAVDAIGVNASGDPVIVAIRQEFEWVALAAVLEAIAPLSALAPVLFSNVSPPLRLGSPRLLLAAERIGAGLDRALGALTVPYELRTVASADGPALDLVAEASGEGAQARPGRRGRRRSGRSGRGGADGRDRARDDSADSVEGAEEIQIGEETGDVPSARSARSRTDQAPDREGDADEERPARGRRRRRSRRGRSDAPAVEAVVEGAASGASDATVEAADTEEVSGRSRSRGGRRSRGRSGGRNAVAARASAGEDGAEVSDEGEGSSRRFEEVSLMDLDDGPDRSPSASEDEGRSSGRGRRGRRRSKGAGSDAKRGGDREAKSSSDGDGNDNDSDSATTSVRVEEEDLVDSDDLEEILARLAEEGDELDPDESTELTYEDDEEIDGEAGDADAQRLEREKRRRERKGAVVEGEDSDRPAPRRRSAIVVHADRDSLVAALLLARDIRQLDGIWIYPQAELMTFFRSVATDLRDDTPIFVVGFSPSPARDVVQAASLYRGRLTWFDRQAWPPEDLVAMRDSIGADAILGGEEIDSSLPLVLETCTRRSRFSDKLVDLATGRFTQHDFERWGRLWWSRLSDIAGKTGDIRSDIAPILTGRPSDLSKEAALIPVPAPPPEVAFVASADLRLVHFGGHMMVIVPVPTEFDLHLSARIARERYGATLSLAYREGGETFAFTGDEMNGKRPLDYLAVVEHLVNKLEWVDARPDADHVARFHVRDLAAHPERLDEILGEIAMGRSLLER